MLEVHRQKNNTLSIEERLEMMIIEWMEKQGKCQFLIMIDSILSFGYKKVNIDFYIHALFCCVSNNIKKAVSDSLMILFRFCMIYTKYKIPTALQIKVNSFLFMYKYVDDT